jgi:four helix bundle protein
LKDQLLQPFASIPLHKLCYNSALLSLRRSGNVSRMKMIFEDLDAWKKARQMVKLTYSITRESPLARDFGLSGQIQRAAVSIMSNIAEGFERHHAAEKVQAYNVARGSCGEVRSLLYVIEDNYPDSAREARQAQIVLADVGSLASGLIAATRKRLVRTPNS